MTPKRIEKKIIIKSRTATGVYNANVLYGYVFEIILHTDESALFHSYIYSIVVLFAIDEK